LLGRKPSGNKAVLGQIHWIEDNFHTFGSIIVLTPPRVTDTAAHDAMKWSKWALNPVIPVEFDVQLAPLNPTIGKGDKTQCKNNCEQHQPGTIRKFNPRELTQHTEKKSDALVGRV
jgi:hypothetical protein